MLIDSTAIGFDQPFRIRNARFGSELGTVVAGGNKGLKDGLLSVGHSDPPKVTSNSAEILYPRKCSSAGDGSDREKLLIAGQSHETFEPQSARALKGHGFSRADFEAHNASALAAEGCISPS